MVTINEKVCSECGWSSPADGRWCENCGRLLVNLLEVNGREQTYLPMVQSNNQLVHLSNDLEYEPKLIALQNRFNQAVAKRKGGGLYWELIGRHIEAYEIQEQIDLAEKSIRYAWSRAVAEVEAQKAQAVVNFHQQQIEHELTFREQEFQRQQEQLNQEFVERMKDKVLIAKVDRYFEAIAHLEKRALADGGLNGLDPEIKREILMGLVNKIEVDVFGLNGTRDGLVFRE